MPLAATRTGDQLILFQPGESPARLPSHPDVPLSFACAVARQDAKTLLVFNPRREEWEWPAGNIDTGETPEAAARCELHEESGQSCTSLRFAGVSLLYLTNRKIYELGAIYTGQLDALKPFIPDQETDNLLFWDGTEQVTGYINALARKLIQLTLPNERGSCINAMGIASFTDVTDSAVGHVLRPVLFTAAPS